MDGFDYDIPDTEYLPSVSASKKTAQSLLTVEEDETFNAAFSKLLKSSRPSYMKNVAEVTKENPKLCHLLTKFTHRQLADKVRSIRKAMVRDKERKSLKKINQLHFICGNERTSLDTVLHSCDIACKCFRCFKVFMQRNFRPLFYYPKRKYRPCCVV